MGNKLHGTVNSFGNQYIWIAVDYGSKWVETVAIKSNDNKVAVKFLKENIFLNSAFLELSLAIIALISPIGHLEHL